MQHGSRNPTPGTQAMATPAETSATTRRSRMRSPEDDANTPIHATVSLPGRPVRAAPLATAAVGSGRPPLPPPRPQSSISALTRDLPPPRSERPQPQMSSPSRPPAAAVLQPTTPSSPSPNISLTAPRPGLQRSQNLYVDAPLLLPQLHGQQSSATSSLSSLSRMGSGRSSLGKSSRRGSSQKKQSSTPTVIPSLPAVSQLALKKRAPPPVPGKLGLEKQQTGVKGLAGDLSDFPSLSLRTGASSLSEDSSSSTSSNDLEDSIICHLCGRCRCEECARPRKLPQKWLCGTKCLVSADTIVDTLSCMWLVKAVMYHCAMEEDDEEPSGFEKPCSCSGPDVAARWACLGAASLGLPCLCCYPLMKGTQRGVEALHRKATSVGCKCEQQGARGVSVITTSPVASVAPLPRSSPGGDSAKSLLG